jgi:beta-1,4-mannosyl-glycoprotein beta-1,4-N-acetylglucosaminyltransferase
MIVDAFIFYNELDILELRFEVLSPYVDKFVLVESEVNHIGERKPLFYSENKERYAKWADKIEHVIVSEEEMPGGKLHPIVREDYQRYAMTKAMKDYPNEAIIMMSDVDEIPDMTKVPWEKLPHMVCSVHMWLYIHSLDTISTDEPWFGTVITTMAVFRKWGPFYLRNNRWSFPTFQYAGWHLSYFGGSEMVINKLRTFSHSQDTGVSAIVNAGDVEENITRCIQNGTWHDGKRPLFPRPPEATLPGSVEVLRRLNLGTFP